MQTYRHVIVPYAFRVMIPAIASEFLTTFKNSALTLTIGVAEITHAARTIEALGLDTYSEPDRFYSYRRATHREEPDYGRQISLIALPA